MLCFPNDGSRAYDNYNLTYDIRIAYGRRAFAVVDPAVWNALGNDLRDPDLSIASFGLKRSRLLKIRQKDTPQVGDDTAISRHVMTSAQRNETETKQFRNSFETALFHFQFHFVVRTA